MSEEMEVKDSEEITDDDRLWALLGYIFGLIALIVLLMEDKKNRPFLRYHAINALLVAAVVVLTSWTACLWVIPWAYGVYVGIQAYKGEYVEIPVLTNFARNQGWI
jgi:uncharacterized protein